MMNGVTISQAAAFAGVTVKTVRHYHKLGLVAEPERDSSGYRRYRPADLLRLVQARTLAAAGVPLAEIGGMLDADDEAFAETLVDVEQRIDTQLRELRATRHTSATRRREQSAAARPRGRDPGADAGAGLRRG
ncbi:MerR family transcriptional regulator [Microbacterium natoriense]